MFRSKRYSGFDPRTLGDCALWLDAADTRTLTLSGSNVTAWVDKSSNSYTCSPVSGNTLTRTTQNGLGVVYMNNARATIPSFVWSNQYTLIAVVSAAGGSFLYSQQVGATYSNYVFTGNQNLMNVNNNLNLLDSVLGSGTKVISSGVYTIFSIGYDSGTSASNYAINGTTRSTTVVSGTAVSPGSNTVALYLNGNSSSALDSTYVAELIHYNNSITAAQRQQVEGYLAWKWGISSSFQPTSISGLSLWLDAADSTSLTLSGSTVTTWADKSGNSKNFTANGTGATYNTSRKALVFTNNRYDSTFSASVTNETLFAVFMPTSNASMYVLYPTPQTGGRGVGTFGSASSYGIINGDVAWGATTSGLGGINTVNIGVSIVSSSSNTQVSVNGGSLTGVTTVPAFSAGRTTMMGVYNGTLYSWVGDIYEIVAYNSVLTTDQRQQVEDYLSRKWNVSLSRTILNLPSSHPFRLAPPVLRPFNPTDIANCALWLDAADPRTMTLSGSNVTAWADKSGNGNNATQSTASLAPAYSATGLNSRLPGLVFTSSNFTPGSTTTPSNLTFMRFPNLQSGTNNASYFAVYQASNDGYVIRNYKTQYNVSYLIIPNLIEVICASNVVSQAITIVRTSFPTMSSFTFSAGTTNTLIGGINGTMTTVVSNVTPPPSTTDNDPLGHIGCYFENPNYYSLPLVGTISELLIFTSTLSTAQRQQVEAYLANKWGLQGTTPSTHPARISPGLSPQFMPTLLSNCALWFDAADAKTITLSASNTVTAIRDKSSNSYSLTGASGFTYATAGFNGRPCFFNSTSNAGVNLGSNTSFNISTPLTIFFAGSKLTSNDAYIVDGYLNGVNRVATMYISGGYYVLGSANINVTTTWAGSNLIVASTLNGASSTGHVNGTLAVSGTTGATTSFGGIIVGARFNVTQPWDGNFCELVIYSGALSTSDRQQVEGYLATKWGLQGSLPSTHPYKLTTLL